MPLTDRKAGATNYPLNKILKIRFALVVCFISIFSLNNSDNLKGRANKLNQEKNKYKANGIRRDLRRLEREKKFLEKFLVEVSNNKSSQSEPETQKQGNMGKEPVRGPQSGQKLWRVLRVAFAIPLLGRFCVRDFSPLRPLMVQGKWEGIAMRLGPDGFAGPP
jgi:hypothetical protein